MNARHLTRGVASALLGFVISALIPPDARAAAGRTEASYGVTQDGAVSYSIPIQVTEGVADMTPRLSIDYAGPGRRTILGPGFALSGISMITPCRQTIAQDLNAAPITLTSADRYCLDGNRLRLFSGTYGAMDSVYRAELDQMIRVIVLGSSGGIPTSFKAEMPDGMEYEYGVTADSKLLASATAGAPPQFWAVNKISDSHGNYMTFTYDRDNALRRFRPSYILYSKNDGNADGGDPHYRISFVYGVTITPTLKYTPSLSGGAAISDDRLLSQIELLHDGAIYRKYKLGYQAGAGGNLRLNSVQDCVPGAPDDCLPATIIAWQSATAGHEAADPGPTVASGAIPLDINGDGADDLVWASAGTWRYTLGASAGYGAAINTGVAAVNPSKAMALDWNGDGLHDLLIDWSDGKWRVLKGATSGFNTTVVDAGLGGISSNTTGLSVTISDVNADGRDDLLSMSLNSVLSINVRYSGVNGFGALTSMFSNPLFRTQSKGFIQATGASSVRRPDFNGDGKFDLLVYACFWEAELNKCVSSYRWYQMMSEGDSFTWEGALPGATYNIDVRFGDFNADGLTDVVYPQATTWTLGLGQGSGGFAIVNGPSNTAHATYQAVIGDYDGDGYDDLYVTENSSWTWKIFRSTGTALATTVISPSPAISANGVGWMMTDQDGDSLPDLGRYDSSSFAWTMYSHKGLPGERFLNATDGLGSKVAFTYLPMSDPIVYDRGITPAFPDQFFVSARPLVRTMAVQPAGDSSGNYTLTYFYKEARRHGQGRLFLGMGWREFTDDRDGSQVMETYKQAFPVVGAIESLRLFQSAGGTKVFHATYQYSHHQLETDPGNERFLPYLLSSNRKTYEVNVGGAKNGLLITEVVESRTVNTFGNLTNQTTTVYDRDSGSSEFGASYESSVASTYKESTADWCINAPTSRNETRTLPDFTSETRSITWTVEPTNCRVTKETIEPNGPIDQSLVTDLAYDACGNVNSISVYPADLSEPTRTTSIDHGTRCQRPEVITNPETHKTRLAYRWDLALPTAHTDPNEFDDTTSPKKTTFEYDGFGRLTRQQRIDNTATRFAIAACGTTGNWCGTGSTAARLGITRTERSTADAILRTDTEILDGLGRPRWSKNDSLESGSAIVETRYDKLDRPIARTQPHFTPDQCLGQPCWTVYVYDLLGRLKLIDAPVDSGIPSGRISQFTYKGRDVDAMDARGITTTRTSNVLGQLRKLVEPSPGGMTTYAYKPFGEIASITDAAGNLTSWNYNGRGFVTGTTDPDSGSWTYKVNAFGETRNIRDAKTSSSAWTTTFAYDKLSRLTSRVDVPESVTTTFVWGASGHNSDTAKYIGRLKSVSMPNYSETYTFDAYARLNKLRTTMQSINWDFDLTYVSSTGLLNTLQYPANGDGFRLTIQNTYQNNILKSVKESDGSPIFWTGVNTDAWGHYKQENFGNGISVVTDFDQANGLMMKRYGGTGGTTNRIDADLDWDPNDNFERRIDHRLSSITEVFEYDAINRLDRSTLNTAQNLDVVYDPDGIGNIATKGGLAYTYTGAQSGCTYNFPHAQPRAVRKIGSTVYCYDANGNMIKRAGSSITYASYNLPTVINSGSNSSTLSYGAFRNRYKQVAVAGGVSEETLYVAGLFERVTPSNGPVQYRHYLPGGNGVAAIHSRSNGIGTTTYVHSDHLGSPELFTKSDGTELLRVSFGAYGERRDGADWSGPPSSGDLTTIAGLTRRGFTGHEHLDAVGLIHMNGRVYDPVAGRFLGADPIVEVGNSQSPNSYAYVWNNPLTMIDPSGFQGEDVTEPTPRRFPECPFEFPGISDDCGILIPGDPDRWRKFEGASNFWVNWRLHQAYLGNQFRDRKPVLARFTAAQARAAVERIQDALVERNCGAVCGIGYAGIETIYEGFIEDALVSIDEARAGNYDKALIAVIFATAKPAKVLNAAKPLLGRNPRFGGTRTKTDLPGDRATAKSIFRNQAKGQEIAQTTMSNGGIRRTAADGTQIRMNPDGTTRIDLPGRGPMPNGETIHIPPQF